jgi:hypothetical protein
VCLLLEIALGPPDVTRGTDVQKTQTRSPSNHNRQLLPLPLPLLLSPLALLLLLLLSLSLLICSLCCRRVGPLVRPLL